MTVIHEEEEEEEEEDAISMIQYTEHCLYLYLHM